MKQKLIILTVLMFLIISGTTLSFASEEVKGTVRQMKGSYITIVTKSGALREFKVTAKTTIFSGGLPSPVKHILPNSAVRVFVKDGKADAIFLQEAPK